MITLKGIILAGGTGSRLWPITKATSKQLVPIYDKPMIYFPVSTLMSAGIKDILIITTPEDQAKFIELLGDGTQFGCNFTYAVQEKANGLAEAFIIGKDFIGNDKVALVLGDNLFHGASFGHALSECTDPDGGIVFAYHVTDPERYGVVDFDTDMNALSIEEKPENPKSNYAVVGLYFFDNSVVKKAQDVQPSARGELEITDINQAYLDERKLQVRVMSRGSAWLDTGTVESLYDAGSYVKAIQDRTGQIIGSIEEVAWRNGWISDEQLRALAEPLVKSGYGVPLLALLDRR